MVFNRKGDEYPEVLSSRTFNSSLGYVPPYDNYKSDRLSKIVPFFYESYTNKFLNFRNSKPHYPCLQRMRRNELIRSYDKQSWSKPSSNFEAHHIIPLEYSGELGWGSAISYSEPLPKVPTNLNECYKKVKVESYNLDNGVLLLKADHQKLSKWWEGI